MKTILKSKAAVAGLRPVTCVLSLLVVSTLGIGTGLTQNKRDLELGSLPPPPDLRQPEEKSFREKMRERRAAAEQKAMEERQAPRPRKPAGPSEEELAARRLSELQKQKRELPPRDPSAPNPEFMTPSGYRLQSFGEPGFWDGQEAPVMEEPLASLPAMPDLTPDSEKSWMERYREKQAKIKQVKELQAQAIAEREEQQRLGAEVARQKALEAANRPQPPAPVYYAYNGPPVQPETPTGKALQAFGGKSRYVQDQQIVYQGQTPESEGLKWIKRGLNPDFSGVDENKAKWSWRNPFIPDTAASNDNFEITPVVGPQGTLQGDVGSSDAVDETQPLVSSLSGIRLVPRTRDVAEGGISGVQGIVNDGVILPPKVASVFEGYLGQPMSLASLNKMVREAIVAYRKSDMPVVDVLVPEQEVSKGTLQLVVIEGRLGDVIVEGNLFTSTKYLENQIRLQNGDIIQESTLMEDLSWMNKNPFRRVDLIYSPGQDYGTTDIILRTEDVNPLNLYIGYEDTGTDLLGQDRLIAGLNWGGPLFFGPDTILSYQYSTNLDGDADLQGHTGVWTSYLPWRHYLTLVGATVSSDATVIVDGEEIDIGGLNRQIGGRYAIPLPAISSLTQELELGFDVKSSNSDLFFNRLEVFDTTTEILQFSLGYNVVQRDRNGMTRIDNEIVWSPGNMTGANDDETFETQRGGASAEYVYARSRLERTFNLPGSWSLVGRVEGQLSNANLLASETLGAGGYDTVRGFEQRIARGDNGIITSLELRTPPVSFAKWSGFYNVRDAMVGLIFFDYAYLANENLLPDEVDSITLGSVGVGIRYQVDDNLTVRLDYGWQIDESGFDDGENGRVHIGARASF
ncbi:MAG: BamA/TamA family outer membrane protein [Verrucomicrobiae bacterium]|nr:BamA/TamA family outer membrane protein [Verrucomicrobiae bacterium]